MGRAVESQGEVAAVEGWLAPILFLVLANEDIVLPKVIAENLCLCLFFGEGE